MANMLFANNCNTTLNGGITAVATSLVVTSATGFPSPTGSQYFYCTLADAATQTTIEIVKVTAVSGTTFTIVRGQDGTTGTIFASGAIVSLRLVRASLNDFPKLDETNTFTADQAITGQLTTSAGLATTNTFTATAPADGLVMDYATGFGRFSAFAGDGFQWYNAGVANTKLMQLSSTGILGIGTAPNTWDFNAIDIVSGGGVGATSNSMYLTANAYYNTSWKYKASSYANLIAMNNANGTIQFFTSPSGTAGNTITLTQAMTLDNAGNLLIGQTTAGGGQSAGGVYLRNPNTGGSASILLTHNSAGGTGNSFAEFFYTTSQVGSIVYNGIGVTYNATSDKRLKNDLGISTDTPVIDNTIIHDFIWKQNQAQSKGVFAQEAINSKPEAVTPGKEDTLNEEGLPKYPWMVDYSKYIPDLIVYCQQLKAKVNTLQQDYDAYKSSHP